MAKTQDVLMKLESIETLLKENNANDMIMPSYIEGFCIIFTVSVFLFCMILFQKLLKKSLEKNGDFKYLKGYYSTIIKSGVYDSLFGTGISILYIAFVFLSNYSSTSFFVAYVSIGSVLAGVGISLSTYETSNRSSIIQNAKFKEHLNTLEVDDLSQLQKASNQLSNLSASKNSNSANLKKEVNKVNLTIKKVLIKYK